jgi:dipeptidyl aminopeptidase/acylaminoacyl peptidase
MIFFPDFHAFAFQTQRLIAEIPGGGAETMEIVRAAERIEDGDFESWREGWEWLGNHTRALAEEAESSGNRVTARESYFRSANYYRSSEFFLPHDDPRRLAIWKKMVACFERAAVLSAPSFQWFRSPYEEGDGLPGYLACPPGAEGPLPTVVYLNGADGTKEESWYLAGKAFVDRGVNFVAIDGPGQGEVLRIQEVYSRPDYEAAISPLYDFLAARADVDADRMALVGISMGGYYAGRVACYEHRFRAFALHGACHSVLEDLYEPYEPIRPQVQWFTGAFEDGRARELLREFDLGPHLDKVTRPTYICHGTEDVLVQPRAAEKTYQGITGAEKELRWWGPEETGSLHANVDNPSEAYPALADWVVDHLRD